MKSVSIIKHAATLSTTDADKLRERLKGQFAEGLKGQFAEGLVLLDGRTPGALGGGRAHSRANGGREREPVYHRPALPVGGEPRGNQGRYRERARAGGYPSV